MIEHSFKLNPEDAVRLGFAPSAFASPLQVHHYVDMTRLSFTRYIIVGIDASYSKFKVSKELYRDNGKMLRSSGDKVLKIVGNIYDLTQLENILSRPCDDEASTVPYDAVRTMLADVIGMEITGNKPLPTSLSVLNSILGHIREDQKDHARLLYQWPIFFDHFRDNPSVLDRAVKGDSLWDALEEFYPKSTIDAARKIKFFSFTWNNLGVSLMNYIKYILFVMGCQPKGGSWPPKRVRSPVS